MTTIRTRIARLTAASAVVVSLGALAAGPAAAQTGTDTPSAKRYAQTGTDIPSRPASAGWTAVKSSAVTFGDIGSRYFQLAAADAGTDFTLAGIAPVPEASASPDGAIQAI